MSLIQDKFDKNRYIVFFSYGTLKYCFIEKYNKVSKYADTSNCNNGSTRLNCTTLQTEDIIKKSLLSLNFSNLFLLFSNSENVEQQPFYNYCKKKLWKNSIIMEITFCFPFSHLQDSFDEMAKNDIFGFVYVCVREPMYCFCNFFFFFVVV